MLKKHLPKTDFEIKICSQLLSDSLSILEELILIHILTESFSLEKDRYPQIDDRHSFEYSFSNKHKSRDFKFTIVINNNMFESCDIVINYDIDDNPKIIQLLKKSKNVLECRPDFLFASEKKDGLLDIVVALKEKLIS